MRLNGNMNVVLYTDDFEPIITVNLPQTVIDYVEKHGIVRLPVQDITSPEPPQVSLSNKLYNKIVTIHANKFRWHDGSIKVILTTSDEELVLKLKPGWLPGQQATINNYKNSLNGLAAKVIALMRKKDD